MEPLTLTPGPGGWCFANWGVGQAWVRFARDEQNQLTRIVEVHTSDPSDVRRIPLGRIQAAATMRGAGLVQLILAMGIDQDPPVSMFSTPPEGGMTPEQRYRLTRPPGKRLGKAFYESVAEAYKSALAFGLNPRQTMVEDTGATDSTVSGWITKARELHYLPKGQPGKATA
jgi:hypothetical protein